MSAIRKAVEIQRRCPTSQQHRSFSLRTTFQRVVAGNKLLSLEILALLVGRSQALHSSGRVLVMPSAAKVLLPSSSEPSHCTGHCMACPCDVCFFCETGHVPFIGMIQGCQT